jgi:YVTN family beta-propeller protein
LSNYTRGWAQEADPSALMAPFDGPTTSSPIAMTQDKKFIWVVNPDDGSVSVLGNLDGTPSVVGAIKNVGQEPQAIALDTVVPGTRAYVVSPPDNGVIVIKVNTVSPFSAVVEKTLITGAEPWNVVASPDGKRIFVANSGQDTITVINAANQTIVGSVDLRTSACNVDDQNRHFQPRGLAVTANSDRLYVARFLSFTKPGGVQGADGGKEGVVCQLNIPGDVSELPTVGGAVRLAPMPTGFKQPNGVEAISHPNQMQSIVIYRDQAYLPNIGAATGGPDRFNSSTMAHVNVIDNINADGNGSDTPADAPTKSINLHLGARDPEPDKEKIFFANPWAIAFRNNEGVVNAYAVSSGSDLLVKLNVGATGALTFTGDVSTTTYIDLNDPEVNETSGRNAGKNPLGIVIRGDKAFTMNYVSRNVSVVDLDDDEVVQVIETSTLPLAGTLDEVLLVGKEVFFASRGHFDRPAGTTVSTSNRLSNEGWQTCSSCHFAGLTDGNVWFFGSGSRKSVPLNASWSPHNPDDQRLFNYSAVFDEVQDFELNIRNTSGPGPLNTQTPPKGPVDCAFLPPPAAPGAVGTTPIFDPNHGLIFGDDGDINKSPCVVNQFAKPNGGRPQMTVTLPGNGRQPIKALDAMKEWVRFSIRTPEGALTEADIPGDAGALDPQDVAAGRRLFFRAGCHKCHGGTKWTISNKDFTSPPAAAELATEAPLTTTNAVQLQFFNRMLFDISSFNLNVAGQGNILPGQPAIGAVELSNGGLKALGFDHNGDGKGKGYNIPALLGIYAVPPYYHNGACETLACVLSNETHRKAGRANGQDILGNPADRANLTAWLETLDADTPFPINLRVSRHDLFTNPARTFKGNNVVVGANIQLFGTKADLEDVLTDLGINQFKVRLEVDPGLTPVDLTLTADSFNQDFGQAVVTTTWSVPANPAGNQAVFKVTIDPDNQLLEDNENDNTATINRRMRDKRTDTTPPVVSAVFISDEDPFENADPFVTTKDVQLKFVATDPAGGGNETISGLKSFCIIKYRYNAALRFWDPFTGCDFEPLPAESEENTYIVDTEISPLAGLTYAFVRVRDNQGNISNTGFDVVSYIPAGPIQINRNDVRIFRIPLAEDDEPITLSFVLDAGDVDVVVFDDFTNFDAERIPFDGATGLAGSLCEEITLTPTAGEANRFQVEVRAIINSRFTIKFAPCDDSVAAAAQAPSALRALPSKLIVGGPPARNSFVEDADDGISVFLPLVTR